MSEKKTVLITGAAGFLASHLAERYLSQGIAVIGLDNFATGLKSNIDYLQNRFTSRFRFIEYDTVNSWSPIEALIRERIEGRLAYLYYLASPASPPHYQRLSLETLHVNSLGLENALLFADKMNARLVYTSTSEVYGDPNITPQSESYWGNVNSFGPRACYDEAKRYGEALIYSWNEKKNTNHGLIRIFNTYGPRMNPNDGRVIINFLVQALAGQNLTIYGDGNQTRSFCFVSDLVDGLVRYGESEIAYPVNFGNDKEFTILDLAKVIQNIFKEKTLKIEFMEKAKDDPSQRRPDLRLAKKLFPEWSPKVDLEIGLRSMIDWLETTKNY